MSKGDVALELGRQIVERTKTNPPLNRDSTNTENGINKLKQNGIT